MTPEPTLWTPAMVSALFAGIVSLLVAVTTMVVTIYGVRKDARAAAEKMDAKVNQVHDLVNAGNSALLERIQRLTQRVATLTGEELDAVEAAAAAHDVSAKESITKAATERKDEADNASTKRRT